MSAKVGIVIPSYNQGKYIERAITSVIANQKNTDIDIAVMDGGSKDETLDVIKRYEKYLKAWCSEPDGGQAAAINKGIAALPDCRYYMWLNSDDIFEDEFAVKKMVEYAEKKGYEVCYGQSHFVDEKDEITGEYPVEEFDAAKLGHHCYLSQPSVMFSKRAYEKVGAINEDLQMCLDYEYWIRLAREYDFGFLREYIGATRMYGETKTATMQKRHLEEGIQILEKYYGKVPAHWMVAKHLCDNPKSMLRYVPKRILMIYWRLFLKEGK